MHTVRMYTVVVLPEFFDLIYSMPFFEHLHSSFLSMLFSLSDSADKRSAARRKRSKAGDDQFTHCSSSAVRGSWPEVLRQAGRARRAATKMLK